MGEAVCMQKLADDFKVITRVSRPDIMSTGIAGICLLPNGEILVSSGLWELEDARKNTDKPILFEDFDKNANGSDLGVQIYLSKDKGESWEHLFTLPFLDGKLFYAGGKVYYIGGVKSMSGIKTSTEAIYEGEVFTAISCSEDNGRTWTKPTKMIEKSCYFAFTLPYYTRGNIYLVAETGWEEDPNTNDNYSIVYKGRPTVMRARTCDDLTKIENWTFATAPAFHEVAPYEEMELWGAPFYGRTSKEEMYEKDYPYFRVTPKNYALHRGADTTGWLEWNITQIKDPTHEWYDPTGRTFYLFSRAALNMANVACMLKVTEKEDGSMVGEVVKVPTGKKKVFLPWPGGHLQFCLIYDEVTKLYWMASSQSTDSMCKPELLGEERYYNAVNERNRLVLYFSKNCIDWCFAGLVDKGEKANESRHYVTMAIDGEDLYLVSRSGDQFARNPHDCDMTTFHKIQNFRRLVY